MKGSLYERAIQVAGLTESPRLSVHVHKVHGIVDSDVADAPVWSEVAPLLGRAVEGLDTVVAFRDDFERRVLAFEGTKLDVAWWDAQQGAVDAGLEVEPSGWLSLASA